MSLASLVNSSYSKVLHDYGVKHHKVESLYHDAQFVLKTLTRDENMLYETLRNYNLSKQSRKDIIDDLFKNEIDQYFILLLKTIVDFNRCSSLMIIIKRFLALCNKTLNIRYIKVISAFELTDAQKEKLSRALKLYYNASSIEINNIVVPEIIGGLKIISEEDSINTSYISKLINIKDESIKALSKYQQKGEQ